MIAQLIVVVDVMVSVLLVDSLTVVCHCIIIGVPHPVPSFPWKLIVINKTLMAEHWCGKYDLECDDSLNI